MRSLIIVVCALCACATRGVVWAQTPTPLVCDSSRYLLGSVATRTAPVYDVTAYGAKHDGATDDTAAIQAAVDAACATRGNVFVPAGIYLMRSTLSIRCGYITFRGAGIGATIFLSDQNITQIQVGPQDLTALDACLNFSAAVGKCGLPLGLDIGDFTVRNTSTSSSAVIGIAAIDAGLSTFHGLGFWGTTTGMQLGGFTNDTQGLYCYSTVFRDIYMQGFSGDGKCVAGNGTINPPYHSCGVVDLIRYTGGPHNIFNNIVAHIGGGLGPTHTVFDGIADPGPWSVDNGLGDTIISNMQAWPVPGALACIFLHGSTMGHYSSNVVISTIDCDGVPLYAVGATNMSRVVVGGVACPNSSGSNCVFFSGGSNNVKYGLTLP